MKYEPKEFQSDDDDESRSSEYTTENNTVVPLPSDDGGVPHRRLASLDGGIHSGVPTRTTATLTPTTLRNIEQTFFELTNEQPTTVPCQAGFVAPLPSFQFEPQPQHQQQQQPHQQQQHQHHQLQPVITQSFTITNLPSHLIDQMQLAPISDVVSNHSAQNHSLSVHDENSYDSFGSSSNSSWTSPPPTLADDSLSGPNSSTPPTSRRRNMGGRRPKNASNLTPAEEEKRKVRRERNKLAAARCRKRRVDQTNELTDKVNVLEKEKQKLQNELQDLQATKNELEYYLQEHRADCRLLSAAPNTTIIAKQEFKQPAISHHQIQIPPPLMLSKIKEEPMDSNSLDADGPPSPKRMHLSNLNNPIISSSGGCETPTSLNTPNILPPSRPNRPSTLAVPFTMTPSQCKSITDMAGVSISTPSNGVMFNFDSLMEGGTGLTPVSQPLMPNYPSIHHRNPLDLATPTTEAAKLVSL